MVVSKWCWAFCFTRRHWHFSGPHWIPNDGCRRLLCSNYSGKFWAKWTIFYEWIIEKLCFHFVGSSYHFLHVTKVQERWRQIQRRWHDGGCHIYANNIVYLFRRGCRWVSTINYFSARISSRVRHVQICVDPITARLCHNSPHARRNVCRILWLTD